MSDTELADLMADAERYVGTAGGGMDQAVCLQAKAGAALRIDFFPLRTRAVPMPDGATVVVANSLVRAEKTGPARLKYNRRPIECRLATKVLAAAARKYPAVNLMGADRLGDLATPNGPISLDELRVLADTVLDEDSYTLRQIVERIGSDATQVRRTLLRLPDGAEFPEPSDGFRLRQRVRHVITEAMRVDVAVSALESGDVREVGRLMDESHASCRDDYEISVPELDALVEVMRLAGAYGARLTGAGFGGCAVALVPTSEVSDFLTKVRERYYRGHLKLGETPPAGFDAWDDVCFATDAGPGAKVRVLRGQDASH